MSSEQTTLTFQACAVVKLLCLGQTTFYFLQTCRAANLIQDQMKGSDYNQCSQLFIHNNPGMTFATVDNSALYCQNMCYCFQDTVLVYT